MALPRQHRLKGHRAFARIYRQGRSHQGSFLVLRILPAQPTLLPREERLHPPSPWRCGIVVSGKVSRKAVQRNRLRRLLHAHLLREPPRRNLPLWLVISLRPGSQDLTPEELLRECSQLFRKAGLTP